MRSVTSRLGALMLAVCLIIPSFPARAAGAVPHYATTEELAYRLTKLHAEGVDTLSYQGVDPAVKLKDNVLIQMVNMALSSNMTRITYTQSNRTNTYTLQWTFAETDTMRREAETVAQNAVRSVIRPGLSVSEQYKALHDWLIQHCTYDAKAEYDGQLAWNALVGKRAVCNGYAKAFKLLCETSGLPCLIVMGEANNGKDGYEPHAWNMVSVDGQWRFIDVTWDDPFSNMADNMQDTYFLMTYEQISEDHYADSLNLGQTPEQSLLRLATLFCPDRVDIADALLGMRLIAGTDAGYALTREVIRVEAATLFSRLLGIDKTYDSSLHVMPFSDVDPWAVPFVAVLYQNGYTSGVGGGLFGSRTPTTLDMYATQLLWALGYDGFVYTQASAKAIEFGLLAAEEVEAIQVRGFLRGDLFTLSHRSLSRPVYNSTQTLGTMLGYI